MKLTNADGSDTPTSKTLQAVGYLLVGLVLVAVAIGVAMVDPGDNPPQVIETQGQTYHVTTGAGLPYTCAAYDPTGYSDPCVYDPDPEGNPVAVEPDNDPVPRWTLRADGMRIDPRADLDTSRVRYLAGTAPMTYPIPPSTSAGRDESRDVSIGGKREDSPGYDCRTMGNGVCGPGANHPAGCYVRKGKTARTMIRPWDAAMAADQHYRPDGCGKRTRRDLEMDRLLSGQVAQVCAPNRSGGVTCEWAP